MTRKALPLILGLIFAFTTQAQVKWHTVEETIATKTESKIYFIDFYTNWCSYCKKMDRETFTDATVSKILNKYFYPIKFNAEGNNTFTWFGRTYRPGTAAANGRTPVHQFASSVRGFPTYVLYSSDGTLLQSIPGFYSAHDFIIILWYFASGDCNKYPFERYKQIFDKEIRPTMLKQLN